MNAETPVPDSLVVALDERHRGEVHQWWESLTDAQRTDFLGIAYLSPEDIANLVDPDDLDSDEEEVNEWYEYIVNHDVRFYFDRSQPPDDDTLHHVVFPIISPVSNAAEIEVVSHLLLSPRRNRSSS